MEGTLIMTKKKRYFPYKKERVLLSDVLPYEIPLTFSNRRFYQFLIQNKIILNEGTNIFWHNSLPIEAVIYMAILFGVKFDSAFLRNKQISISEHEQYRIPYTYKISHSMNKYRELSIPHPFNQLYLVNFYDTYKESILYYTNLSSFSLRKPSHIARYSYFKDKLHYDNVSGDIVTKVEEYDQEYENIKTFFAYKKFSNIYKFYESPLYLRAEQKFMHLTKVDISSCFDSIYTHSISWAIYGKKYVKDNLGKSKKTFPGKFDILMENLNYKETNGIIIGPEFSRIFAEIILQAIDVKLEKILFDEKKYKSKHYQIFRYVDDYFIFYNENETRDLIITELGILLKEYKLCFNDSKREDFDRPIITNLSIAKEKISSLFDKYLTYEFEKTDSLNKDSFYKGKIHINSQKLKTKFKSIVKDEDVEYQKVIPFTMSVVINRLMKIFKSYKKQSIDDYKIQHIDVKAMILNLQELIDFMFFIYSADARVTSTIKLCQFLNLTLNFVKKYKKLKNIISADYKYLIYKTIYDRIDMVLSNQNPQKPNQLEALYLYIILRELGKHYWLSANKLTMYVKPYIDNPSFWLVSVMLFYMQDKKEYSQIKEKIVESAIKKIQKLSIIDTERALLCIDLLSCSYVDKKYKEVILREYDVEKNYVQDFITKSNNYNWFTKWNSFNFEKEIDNKRSREVY